MSAIPKFGRFMPVYYWADHSKCNVIPSNGYLHHPRSGLELFLVPTSRKMFTSDQWPVQGVNDSETPPPKKQLGEWLLGPSIRSGVLTGFNPMEGRFESHNKPPMNPWIMAEY